MHLAILGQNESKCFRQLEVVRLLVSIVRINHRNALRKPTKVVIDPIRSHLVETDCFNVYIGPDLLYDSIVQQIDVGFLSMSVERTFVIPEDWIER